MKPVPTAAMMMGKRARNRDMLKEKEKATEIKNHAIKI
jgi:hypothetical protein